MSKECILIHGYTLIHAATQKSLLVKLVCNWVKYLLVIIDNKFSVEFVKCFGYGVRSIILYLLHEELYTVAGLDYYMDLYFL